MIDFCSNEPLALLYWKCKSQCKKITGKQCESRKSKAQGKTEGSCYYYFAQGWEGDPCFTCVIDCSSVIEDDLNLSTETQKPESYISCGCGCCGFDEPLEEIAKVECLYKSKGESIQDKIDQDKQIPPELCATVGCSFPIKYVYCD